MKKMFLLKAPYTILTLIKPVYPDIDFRNAFKKIFSIFIKRFKT